MNRQAARTVVPGARLARAAIALAVGLALLTVPGCGPPTRDPLACTAIGQTWTRPADEMTLVCVPAGTFLMGSAADDADALDREKPQHEVYLDAYWIDRTEVSNAQYARFVQATNHRGPYGDENWAVDYNWDRARQSPPMGQEEHPVVLVNWDDAVAYCAWAGSALPTEAQWEKAARGPDGRVYPWGHAAPTCERANYQECGLYRPAAVGRYPDGASPYEALDMAGNVWEWTSSLYRGYPYRADDGRESLTAGDWRVLRGGAFLSFTWWVRAASRFGPGPTGRNVHIGFRCAGPARGTP